MACQVQCVHCNVWKTYSEIKEHLESCGNQEQSWALITKYVHVPISVHEYQGFDNEKF